MNLVVMDGSETSSSFPGSAVSFTATVVDCCCLGGSGSTSSARLLGRSFIDGVSSAPATNSSAVDWLSILEIRTFGCCLGGSGSTSSAISFGRSCIDGVSSSVVWLSILEIRTSLEFSQAESSS